MVTAYAAPAAGKPLELFSYRPEPLGPLDVEIAVSHCGVCRTDVDQIDNSTGRGRYPLVPGHEIVGRIAALGTAVKTLSEGQRVGAGFQSGADHSCEWCLAGQENVCPDAQALGIHRFGGYADAVRLDSRFVHPIPDALPAEAAAPLLCAGATAYAPLCALSAGPGTAIGVIGIGGIGHLAIQFARAMGAEVTALSRSPDKEAEARHFGAQHFIATGEPASLVAARRHFHVLLSTVSADLDWTRYIDLLGPNGTLCFVGFPAGAVRLSAHQLILGQNRVMGSHGGSPAVIREMLEFARSARIRPQTQPMAMRHVNEALDRVRRNAARYRIVLTAWAGD